MPRTGFASVDDYIAAQPKAARPVLQRVREAIRKALPKAEEVISYQIAAYRQHGLVVLYFAGFKEHYSIYPASGALVAAFAKELAPYEYNGKGTIRFPMATPVPVRLIAHIAKFKAQEAAERAAARGAVKKRSK